MIFLGNNIILPKLNGCCGRDDAKECIRDRRLKSLNLGFISK